MEKTLKELFDNSKKLSVPAYQRAYAWGQKQLDQFISDLIDYQGDKSYYYGHFILESKDNSELEIIDGQQRITTFILFLIVCEKISGNNYSDSYINKFETVSFDNENFSNIKNFISNNSNWYKENSIVKDQTLSIERILFALKYFNQKFNSEKEELDRCKIDKYVSTLLDSHISTHKTTDKAVSVQIFELQNTRGIQLNLIEKVKSKLMKEVYLKADSSVRDNLIHEIQGFFAEIYKMEESVNSNSFRGNINLEEILLLHLRIIDDGSKLDCQKDANLLRSPAKSGNREELILNYIDKQINSTKNPLEYIKNLVELFKNSVYLVCEQIPKLDYENSLIGDVLILDKTLSLEFFILLHAKNFTSIFKNKLALKHWEKLLFTRDFHDKYYRVWYKDNFEQLFFEIGTSISDEKTLKILEKYVELGFRNDLMIDGDLQKTVSKYIQDNESNILNHAYYWWLDKMVYLLYKYELSKGANFNDLRKIMKEGRSVEHILPQSWEWEWINEDKNKVSDNGKKFNEEIGKCINGIGNLLLINSSENASVSNNHPKEKQYSSCSGGSYQQHEQNKKIWEDYQNWIKLIHDRGEKIYAYITEYFNLNL